eukprot:CAMPEP_0183484628 /NCGR_PEP_ID=MMETSP0370-20130417/179017_1 /TAXON_ID=268820 /ORGANISM="Peridinium aciculiferum, Strain PAER-2" /LENGTH=321 /DNA_ID=CAMNT_0025677919 /DNA_START=217 /DNA_END=1185 /DNA_ORIENTATION=-
MTSPTLFKEIVSSSGNSTSKPSSSAMTDSTMSRESAPSSVSVASRVTLALSTPSCSAMMSPTLLMVSFFFDFRRCEVAPSCNSLGSLYSCQGSSNSLSLSDCASDIRVNPDVWGSRESHTVHHIDKTPAAWNVAAEPHAKSEGAPQWKRKSFKKKTPLRTQSFDSELRRDEHLKLRLNEIHDVADALQGNGLLVGQLDIEALLQCHDGLDDVQGVGAELRERGLAGDLGLIYAKLLRDDVAHLAHGVRGRRRPQRHAAARDGGAGGRGRSAAADDEAGARRAEEYEREGASGEDGQADDERAMTAAAATIAVAASMREVLE